MELSNANIMPRCNGYVAEVNGKSCYFDNWVDAVIWVESEFGKKGGDEEWV